MGRSIWPLHSHGAADPCRALGAKWSLIRLSGGSGCRHSRANYVLPAKLPAAQAALARVPARAGEGHLLFHPPRGRLCSSDK